MGGTAKPGCYSHAADLVRRHVPRPFRTQQMTGFHRSPCGRMAFVRCTSTLSLVLEQGYTRCWNIFGHDTFQMVLLRDFQHGRTVDVEPLWWDLDSR